MNAGTTTRSMWHLFLAWQSDREEAWLGEMSRQGWHLVQTNGFRYRFEKGEPKSYVYRLDYQGAVKFDRQEYVDLFRDAGWQHVDSAFGWHYFRTLQEGNELPDIYSDPVSRLGKYQRVLTALVILFGVNVYFFAAHPASLKLLGGRFMDLRAVEQVYFVARLLNGLAALILGYAAFKLWRTIHARK